MTKLGHILRTCFARLFKEVYFVANPGALVGSKKDHKSKHKREDFDRNFEKDLPLLPLL